MYSEDEKYSFEITAPIDALRLREFHLDLEERNQRNNWINNRERHDNNFEQCYLETNDYDSWYNITSSLEDLGVPYTVSISETLDANYKIETFDSRINAKGERTSFLLNPPKNLSSFDIISLMNRMKQNGESSDSILNALETSALWANEGNSENVFEACKPYSTTLTSEESELIDTIFLAPDKDPYQALDTIEGIIERHHDISNLMFVSGVGAILPYYISTLLNATLYNDLDVTDDEHSKGVVALLDRLHDAGFDFNQRLINGDSLLCQLSGSKIGDKEINSLIEKWGLEIQSGIDYTHHKWNEPIMVAYAAGNFDVVNYMLDSGFEMSSLGENTSLSLTSKYSCMINTQALGTPHASRQSHKSPLFKSGVSTLKRMIDEGFDISRAYKRVAKDTNVIGETTNPCDENATPIVFSLFDASKFPTTGANTDEIKQFFGKGGLVESAIKSFAKSDNRNFHMHNISSLVDNFAKFAVQSTEEFPSVFTNHVKMLMDNGINIFDIFKREAAKSDLETDMPLTKTTEPLTLMLQTIIFRLERWDDSFDNTDNIMKDLFDLLEYAKDIGENIVLGRTDSDKKNALHLIAQNDAIFPVEAMGKLIDMFPHMLEEKNSGGRTPTEESIEKGSGVFDIAYKNKLLEESLEIPTKTIIPGGNKRF